MHSVNDIFPMVSLNFAGGATMVLRGEDYLIQQNSIVSQIFFELINVVLNKMTLHHLPLFYVLMVYFEHAYSIPICSLTILVAEKAI